ncbi:LOW QUALITY PROTEIN: eukaryotic translation initiation factor 4E transporter [Sarcophilus harrisii]
MDRRGGGETENGEPFLDLKKLPASKSPHRYTKEELLDIKERPHSKQRPSCLSEKYDSDGVWDPEKWHASLYPTSGRNSPVENFKKELDLERPLMRKAADPRERVKEDDLDVVLSPQRRSFGGGCHVTTSVSSRRSGSPLEKDSDGVRMIGGRRIGSGRIISYKDHRSGDKDLRDCRDSRDRERDYKDKRFRREFGDSKRVFGERRRNDSYTEEEPEWFSAGPTSQSETIELTGFDDKILEEDHKGRKRTRRRAPSVKEGIVSEFNGGVAEEDEVEVILAQEPAADQEVPREAVLPEQSPGEFDFNEFFNLDKVPGLASMIEDVLGEGSVSASSFSRWFSNLKSGSRSSSLGSTPHEELEKLAGLEQAILSPGQNNYFAPIPLEDHAENKVDILEMKAKGLQKPLLSSLSANKEKLKESSHSGVVLWEEVARLKGLRVTSKGRMAPPFLAERSEEWPWGLWLAPRPLAKDGDMSAFNKLVSTMKASGTLPSQPKVNRNLESHLMSPAEILGPLPKNILQVAIPPFPSEPSLFHLLSGPYGKPEPTGCYVKSAPFPPISQVFPTRAASADYLRLRIPHPLVLDSVPQQLLGDPFHGMRKSMSPVAAQMNPELQHLLLEGFGLPHELAMQAASFYQPGHKPQTDKSRDGFRSRQQRVAKSPPWHRGNSASPAPVAVTSMLPSFTPTSSDTQDVRKEKSKEDPISGKPASDVKEEGQRANEENLLLSSMANPDRAGTSPPHEPQTLHAAALDIFHPFVPDQLPTATGLPAQGPARLFTFQSSGLLISFHPPGLVQTEDACQGSILSTFHLCFLLVCFLLGWTCPTCRDLCCSSPRQPFFYPPPCGQSPLLTPRSGTSLQSLNDAAAAAAVSPPPPGSGSQGTAIGVQTPPQNPPGRPARPHIPAQRELDQEERLSPARRERSNGRQGRPALCCSAKSPLDEPGTGRPARADTPTPVRAGVRSPRTLGEARGGSGAEF